MHACFLTHATKLYRILVVTESLALQDDEDAAEGDRPAAEGGLAKEKKGLLGPKKEADYDFFVSDIWSRISTKEEKQIMTAPLVWQVLPFAVNLHCRLFTYCFHTNAGRELLLVVSTCHTCWTPYYMSDLLDTLLHVDSNPFAARPCLSVVAARRALSLACDMGKIFADYAWSSHPKSAMHLCYQHL